MWAVRIFSAEEAKESENGQRCNLFNRGEMLYYYRFKTQTVCIYCALFS